ncbi:MAG: class I SAM-dependent methyltransferase [Solirubrobacterales bacterium]|nr:class I SAM-dependent methyltransferase [Solirubrobacterales bacterium]
MNREQRLVFGEVAELYERHRPAYPDALVDDLVELSGVGSGGVALEIGAGTGKATAMFAARGIRVLAVEPSAEMAAVARRVCAAYPGVEIEQADFERWDAAGRDFPLAFAGQAWHWVDPAIGFAKVASVLRPAGVFAAFWNWTVWARSSLRGAMVDAYRNTAPEILVETDAIHPGRTSLPTDDEEFKRGIDATDDLDAFEVRDYEWSLTYSAADYAALLQTHSTIRALDPDRRRALVGAVAQAIESHGGRLTLPVVTRLCMARRIGTP